MCFLVFVFYLPGGGNPAVPSLLVEKVKPKVTHKRPIRQPFIRRVLSPDSHSTVEDMLLKGHVYVYIEDIPVLLF